MRNLAFAALLLCASIGASLGAPSDDEVKQLTEELAWLEHGDDSFFAMLGDDREPDFA